MKPKSFKFLNVLNTAAARAVTVLESVINDVRCEAANTETWQRMVEFGEYPATAVVNGRETEITQVLDRQACEAMAQNYATVINQIKHLGRGLPIFVGHPDNKAWLKENPGADESAKGRIKGLEVREDGIYMLTAFNDDGAALLGGDAPAYSAHSPNWDMLPEAPGSKRYRPYVLKSIGLTNRPNISSCVVGLNMAGGSEPSPSDPAGAGAEPEKRNDDDMKLTAEALKALGFAPDATPTPDEISAAVVTLLGKMTTAEAAVTAANTRATTATTELENLRTNLVTTAINTAVTSGRITEAQKAQWEGILKADFVNGNAALEGLTPVAGVNTRNHLPGNMGERQVVAPAAGDSIEAINTAVIDYAKEHGLDLKKPADYDRAFAGVKAAKPQLFAKK